MSAPPLKTHAFKQLMCFLSLCISSDQHSTWYRVKTLRPGRKSLFTLEVNPNMLAPCQGYPQNFHFPLWPTAFLKLLVFIYFISQSWWILKSILTSKHLWRLASSVWHHTNLHFLFFSSSCKRSKNYSNKKIALHMLCAIYSWLHVQINKQEIAYALINYCKLWCYLSYNWEKIAPRHIFVTI